MIRRQPLDLIWLAGVACIAVTFLFFMFGCASVNIEADEIAEMYAYAYAHRDYDREDSKRYRLVDAPDAECANINSATELAVAAARFRGTPYRGCTVFGEVNYSILAKDATAYELAHEAAHRRYGDWHKGFYYLGVMR